MVRKVIWSQPALKDFQEIQEYLIAQDSLEYARQFAQEVVAKARSLQDYSERGRYVPELTNQRFRELLVGKYRLLYQVREYAVEVVALAHGRRDLLKFLRERKRRPTT